MIYSEYISSPDVRYFLTLKEWIKQFHATKINSYPDLFPLEAMFHSLKILASYRRIDVTETKIFFLLEEDIGWSMKSSTEVQQWRSR